MSDEKPDGDPIAAAVSAALEKMGLSPKAEPAANPAAPSQPPPSPAARPQQAPSIDYKQLASAIKDALGGGKPAAEDKPPVSASPSFADALKEAAGSNVYQAPGAPSGGPRDVSIDAFSWSQDDIRRMQADGTFRENLEKWRRTYESTDNPPEFRKRIPSGGGWNRR